MIGIAEIEDRACCQCLIEGFGTGWVWCSCGVWRVRLRWQGAWLACLVILRLQINTVERVAVATLKRTAKLFFFTVLTVVVLYPIVGVAMVVF